MCGTFTYYFQTHFPTWFRSFAPLPAQAKIVSRTHDEKILTLASPVVQSLPSYPWEQSGTTSLPKITKEHFRCKGSPLNPVRINSFNQETTRYFDCGGATKHSIPLKNGKEYIYAIEIDLLNYIQTKTGKRVVITSGYRCPEHNTYVDSSPENQYSKHMIGAEVSFYVQGLEERPDFIVKLIQDYYQKQPEFEFQRYHKNTNVSTPPWFNKEIFVKLFQSHEGRNFDNRHPYPYVSIQVRWDRESNEKVVYSWDKAFRNYLRY